MIFLHNDTNPELSDLAIYFYETNFFYYTPEQTEIYDLFTYLVNRGYAREATDLWDNIIVINRNVKAS